jgi:acetyl-CoA/propionyl-CoA carboxylase carboxyl transferase subunit
MGARAAVGVLHRRTLAAAPEHEQGGLREALVAAYERDAGGVARAMSIGVVDEVIEPAKTRHVLAEALAAAPRTRGGHDNIPL